ncbi:MAG: hypothetical protein OEV92_09800 [Nitrospinota bacterium]|nr:hypothetical protein [Nitrospinota bacterium]
MATIIVPRRKGHDGVKTPAARGMTIAAASLLAITLPFIGQARAQEELYARPTGAPPASALVVFHSRSGATRAMASQIARRLEADMLPIKAKAYPEGFSGWQKAMEDSWNKKPSVIEPEKFDLRPYKLVLIGAPIWWYRPSPPVWTFVEKNDFTGLAVVLFSTFNSGFKQEEIEQFKKLVERQGGRFLDHISIRRGRVYWQKSQAELLEETDKIVEEKMEQWRSVMERPAPIGAD